MTLKKERKKQHHQFIRKQYHSIEIISMTTQLQRTKCQGPHKSALQNKKEQRRKEKEEKAHSLAVKLLHNLQHVQTFLLTFCRQLPSIRPPHYPGIALFTNFASLLIEDLSPSNGIFHLRER